MSATRPYGISAKGDAHRRKGVPSPPASRLFSFMKPLAYDVWLYVLAAYFLVSFTIYFVAKFSPIECRGMYPYDMKRPNSTNQFSLANSFWFTIGTLMQQGSDINPKSISTRIVSALWWFFTLIIIASYTANLAAFLTVERMITPIENAEDLASQTEISYGTLESGSTMTFFRDSILQTYHKMWRTMENKKATAFTTTYEEGIRRVNQGNYAFLMESTMLDYIVQRDCNLTQIGGLLDTKGYGIATPKESPWRDKISLSILALQERGDIQILYDKWWKSTGDTCIRTSVNKQAKANALDLDKIGGVFVFLLLGIAIAICVAVLEFWYRTKKIRSLYCEEEQHDTIIGKVLVSPNWFNLLNRSNQNGLNIYRAEQQFIQKQKTISSQNREAYCCVSNTAKRSLCEEMYDELTHAIRCMDSHQRPDLKRRCAMCNLFKDVQEIIEAESTN